MSSRQLRMLAACCALLAFAASGCGTDTAQSRATSSPRPMPSSGAGAGPSDAPADGWQPPLLEWTPCDVASDAECATMQVPLDWSEPGGDTVELALARLPATGESRGSILTNPGGPGGSGIEFLGYDSFSSELRSEFDLVSWDPRGVGDSEGLRCGDSAATMLALDQDPDDDAEQRELEAAAAEVSSACAAEDQALLEHIGTETVAMDLEAIRRALGDEGLNYVGFSYGTQIGQAYAERYPEQVRAMVLDGVVDPSLSFTDFLREQALAFEAAFDRNDEQCREAGERACGVDDLAGAYDTLAAQLENSPLGSGSTSVGPAELALAAITASYNADGWTQLGPALARALDGNAAALRRIADSYLDFGGYGAYAAVVCTDTAPPRGVEAYRAFADDLRDAAPRFGAGVANEMLPCATWPAPPTGSPAGVTAEGSAPILVVGNVGDPATPYDNAVAVAARLDNATLLSVESDGHTAYNANRCAREAIDRYLLTLELPAEGSTCG